MGIPGTHKLVLHAWVYDDLASDFILGTNQIEREQVRAVLNSRHPNQGMAELAEQMAMAIHTLYNVLTSMTSFSSLNKFLNQMTKLKCVKRTGIPFLFLFYNRGAPNRWIRHAHAPMPRLPPRRHDGHVHRAPSDGIY